MVNRLPFGISPASGIFQNIVEKTLQGIQGVVNFLDNILIMGQTSKDHLKNLETVFERLTKAGFKLERSKYLGYIISKNGLS